MTTPQDTINTPQQSSSQKIAVDTVGHSARQADSNEHWIARVVRQMQGCSPSKIDSVIQANLPPRKIRWSQRPDTLCIPGLEGRLPYAVDSLKWEYDPGFFRGNALMHPELPPLQHRVTPKPLTQPYPHYDSILGMIILCFALLSLLINYTRDFLQIRGKDFFYTANSNDFPSNDKATPPALAVPITYLLLCATGSLFALHYAQSTYGLRFCPIPLHALLATYAGCVALMFVAKRLLSAFINWIFFDKGSRQLWRVEYNFLLTVETITLLPIVAMGFCFDMQAKTVLTAGLAIVAVVKILLLYKAFEIFIPKFYGILHLLSYLCALEIIPFLALWVALQEITEHLTITF